jgi:hypothetical protein
MEYEKKISLKTVLTCIGLIILLVLYVVVSDFLNIDNSTEIIVDNFKLVDRVKNTSALTNTNDFKTCWKSDSLGIVIDNTGLYWETVDKDNTVYKMKVTKKRNSDDGQATIQIGDKTYQGCSVYSLSNKEG